MNFLLYMLGQTHRAPLILRPTPRQQLRASAAASLAIGNLDAALATFTNLATETNGSVGDTLIRAHLHLATNDYLNAVEFFSLGLERIGDAPTILDRMIDSGEAALRQGHYVRATNCFQRARAAIDTLVSANAGLAVANARLSNSTSPAPAVAALLPLVKLGDLTLRMLARTHLAGNLAVCLRERSLRDDLAAWATSNISVENLLASECRQFEKHIRSSPGHAEFHYRLGLVARTLDRPELAAKAFTRVLNLHPHHLSAAARLAITRHQLGHADTILPLLALAFAVPSNILQQYAALASAASDTPAFDGAAERLCHTLAPESRPTAKANLAFALSELGLLDDAHAEWREPVVA